MSLAVCVCACALECTCWMKPQIIHRSLEGDEGALLLPTLISSADGSQRLRRSWVTLRCLYVFCYTLIRKDIELRHKRVDVLVFLLIHAEINHHQRKGCVGISNNRFPA